MGVNLEPGKNEMESQFLELDGEFDLELNPPFTPSTVIFGSGKKVFWNCPQDHSYLKSVNARTSTNHNWGLRANPRDLRSGLAP
jgi:hypothetical protein